MSEIDDLLDRLIQPRPEDWRPRIADVFVRTVFGSDGVEVIWLLQDPPPPGWTSWVQIAVTRGCLALTPEIQRDGSTGVVLAALTGKVSVWITTEVERALEVATELWREAGCPEDATAAKCEQRTADLEDQLRSRLRRRSEQGSRPKRSPRSHH